MSRILRRGGPSIYRVHIQLAYVTVALAVEQRLAKVYYFLLALFEKAQSGADYFTRGSVGPAGELQVDEMLEVIAETDTGGLAQPEPPKCYYFIVIIGSHSCASPCRPDAAGAHCDALCIGCNHCEFSTRI